MSGFSHLVVFLRFTNVPAYLLLSLLNNIPLYEYATFWFFYSPNDGYLDNFSLLDMKNNAAINIHAQASVRTYVFSLLLGCIVSLCVTF